MTYKVIGLVLENRGTLYMVSQIDCVNADVVRYNKEPVVSYHIRSEVFDSIADAWSFVGKLLDNQKARYIFVPQRKTHTLAG